MSVCVCVCVCVSALQTNYSVRSHMLESSDVFFMLTLPTASGTFPTTKHTKPIYRVPRERQCFIFLLNFHALCFPLLYIWLPFLYFLHEMHWLSYSLMSFLGGKDALVMVLCSHSIGVLLVVFVK